MKKRLSRNLFIFCAAFLFGFTCRADSNVFPAADSDSVDAALSWLPADTETVTVSNGPFWMSNFQLSDKEEQERSISVQNLEKGFQGWTLGLFNLESSGLERHLERQKLLFAVQGARHFRSPTSLGSFMFEGCQIAAFANDVSEKGVLFFKDSAKTARRFEEIAGVKVAVFQDRLEEDTWTTFVAFPRANIVVVATNEGFLREVLTRIRGTNGARALPDTLPEWKYVNKKSPFWGLRHFDRSQARVDLTSPFQENESEGIPDKDAIGIVFASNPAESRSSTVTYISNNHKVLSLVTEHLFPAELMGEGAKGLNARYRTVESGVVEGAFDLSETQSYRVSFWC